MIITVEHLHTVPTWTRRTGFCHKQTRQWFADHDLDFLGFVHNGIDEEVLLATGDALARRLVTHAHQYEETRHGR